MPKLCLLFFLSHTALHFTLSEKTKKVLQIEIGMAKENSNDSPLTFGHSEISVFLSIIVSKILIYI